MGAAGGNGKRERTSVPGGGIAVEGVCGVSFHVCFFVSLSCVSGSWIGVSTSVSFYLYLLGTPFTSFLCISLPCSRKCDNFLHARFLVSLSCVL